MSETRFTPGEWRAIHIDCGTWMVVSDDGDTTRRIAVFEPSHYVTPAECEANAKALAASKEMYAALTSWVEYMERLDDGSDSDDPLAEARRLYHGKRMAASRAALAKANPQPKEGMTHAKAEPDKAT